MYIYIYVKDLGSNCPSLDVWTNRASLAGSLPAGHCILLIDSFGLRQRHLSASPALLGWGSTLKPRHWCFTLSVLALTGEFPGFWPHFDFVLLPGSAVTYNRWLYNILQF